MPERPGPELGEALETIEVLRAENARLRGLLGLDERVGDGHVASWRPTLFDQPAEEVADVDASSPPEAKLGLAWSLFGARHDVFATRWENTSTGKSGWSPAVRGGWSSKRARSRKEYLPLTEEVFARHFRGEATVGIYPLLPGDRCALLACDFDDSSWALDALAYLDVCHDNGVPAVLERSRSGNGAHVWVFFDTPVEAAVARSMGASLLRMAMTARAELDLASYDRFFPSQDFMPKGSFGNLIALPLQGERLSHGMTAFLDPTTMQPWADQWAFLASIARLSADAVRTLAEALRPVDAGPSSPLRDLAREQPELPDVVHARLGAGLSIERAGLPPSVVAALKHLGSIHNPSVLREAAHAVLPPGTRHASSAATKRTCTGSTSHEVSSNASASSSMSSAADSTSSTTAPATGRWAWGSAAFSEPSSRTRSMPSSRMSVG